MPDRDGTEEPLQSLPPGMAWRYARGKEVALSRSRDGLVVIDSLLENPEAKRGLTGLPTAIGMFYGDVRTHLIPGAHWEVVEAGFPLVRISRNTSISVIRVTQRRLDVGLPTPR